MEKTNNIIIKAMLCIFAILFLIGNISAFAVSSAYYKDNPLKLQRGETFDFYLVLQNPQGESVSLKANIIGGFKIIQITDSSYIYNVPAGEKKNVNLRAIIPEDAKIGQVYPVNVEFITIQESGSGEFGFGTAIGRNFDVIVTREDGTISLLPKGSLTLIIALAIIVMIIALMITLIAMKKKAKKKR